jgi:hypothetical protein
MKIRFVMLAVVVLAIAAVVLSACSDKPMASTPIPGATRMSTDTATHTPSNAAASEPTADKKADEGAAKAALLTVDDFPTGWAESPADDSEDTGSLEKCNNAGKGRTARVTSPDFSNGSSVNISETIAVYQNSNDAVAVLAKLQPTMDCFVKAINDGAFNQNGISASNARYGALSFPSLSAGSKVYRVTFDVKEKSSDLTLSAAIDLVWVINGRAGFSLQYTDVFGSPDTNEMSELADKALAKISNETTLN